MKRLELLINDVRFEVGNPDTTRFPDIKFNNLFRQAQNVIQSVITQQDVSGKFFNTNDTQDIVANQSEYDLPSDILASSAIISVGILVEGSNPATYTPLDMVTERENRLVYGYGVRDDKLFLSLPPSIAITDGLKITYVKKLPELSIRVGKIASYISATSITLNAGYSSETIGNFDDFITVVDKDGTIKQSGIRFTAYAAGVISTPDALTNIAANDYVVLGKLASSHSELPDVCEGIMMSLVKKAIFAINASKEFNMQDLITQQEKDVIMGLFKKNDHDVLYPPISDNSYENY